MGTGMGRVVNFFFLFSSSPFCFIFFVQKLASGLGKRGQPKIKKGKRKKVGKKRRKGPDNDA